MHVLCLKRLCNFSLKSGHVLEFKVKISQAGKVMEFSVYLRHNGKVSNSGGKKVLHKTYFEKCEKSH